MIDGRLSVGDLRRVVGADLFAGAAAHTEALVYAGLPVTVLLHLSCPGAAAHTDIFQGTAEARHLMEIGRAHV